MLSFLNFIYVSSYKSHFVIDVPYADTVILVAQTQLFQAGLLHFIIIGWW